jgi:hypothetical protein
MSDFVGRSGKSPLFVLIGLLFFAVPIGILAQAGQRGGGGQRGGRGGAAGAPAAPGAPPPAAGPAAAAPAGQRGSGARAAAPVDLTGYWVSIVTEDWLNRMITPPKGNRVSMPGLTQAGNEIFNAWDSSKDQAAGEACRAYGAAGIMRVPGRLRISWADDNTLKIETDAGSQTRWIHIGVTQPPANETKSWQGYSIGTWEVGGRGGFGRGGGAGATTWGTLKVVTTHLRMGYLRPNGFPYSENAVVTEYFDRHTDFGQEWFTVTTTVDDPTYLTQNYITSSSFRKEPDGSKFSPGPCEAVR